MKYAVKEWSLSPKRKNRLDWSFLSQETGLVVAWMYAETNNL
jgi:hypothetical protein